MRPEKHLICKILRSIQQDASPLRASDIAGYHELTVHEQLMHLADDGLVTIEGSLSQSVNLIRNIELTDKGLEHLATACPHHENVVAALDEMDDAIQHLVQIHSETSNRHTSDEAIEQKLAAWRQRLDRLAEQYLRRREARHLRTLADEALNSDEPVIRKVMDARLTLEGYLGDLMEQIYDAPETVIILDRSAE